MSLSGQNQNEPGLAARLLQEPLLHFLLIGVAVFLAFGRAPEVPAQGPQVIEVTPARIERLAGQFEAVWRRAPTEDELAALIEDFVREEVYYREALALGLDRDDTVIRRRLRQKMEFLGDAGAGALTPGEAALEAHFAAHIDAFTPPARVTFQQVALGDEDADAVTAALEAGADPATVGRGSLLPATMEAAAATAVDGTFGPGFFAAVAALTPGGWQRPVDSAYGPHLVRLIELEPSQPPPFERVRDRVEAEWRQRKATELREAQYRALRERYEVVLPEASAP
jgi:hypothetical protein